MAAVSTGDVFLHQLRPPQLSKVAAAAEHLAGPTLGAGMLVSGWFRR